MIDVPDYSWEAVQGDDTDLILTESMFERFGNIVQDDLEKGAGPGTAFEDAFVYALKSAESKLNPSVGTTILRTITSSFPMLFSLGIFIPMIIMAIKSYKKDRDVEYEEVPLDENDVAQSQTIGGVPVNGYSKSFQESADKVSKFGSIFSIIFIIPFLIVGVSITVTGLVTLGAANDSVMGIFTIIFGIAWSIISFTVFFQTVKGLIKGKKKADVTPLTAEYPKAEYPKAEYPKADYPDVSGTSQPAQTFQPGEPEFDPAFFQSAKSDIEDDDEDYKRMKRKGYE